VVILPLVNRADKVEATSRMPGACHPRPDQRIVVLARSGGFRGVDLGSVVVVRDGKNTAGFSDP